jgi:hypothetical protein
MKAINLEDAIKLSKPFTIKMDNGEKFTIKHPDFILLSPSKATAVVFHPDDHFEIIDIEHISSIRSATR